ncbi:MAG: B12-binding domain-containing radical SAM protein [Nitrospirae bacterium]|nr:B12-binding domain-containing radical SAM protein [Nitrospirota bacterium]MBF0592138.1 B12-binding domain-containing radical SAM protein [Nitrospirota bacterium]
MKLTLITPTPPDISAFGVRSLSAYLRGKGHAVDIIFLPGSIGLLKEGGGYVYSYEPALLDQIVEFCRNSQLIGLSFMTNYFDRATQVTQRLRKTLRTPIIWGGIHPSCKPEEALDFADIVCVGEGEEALLELMQHMQTGTDFHGIAGLYFKKDANIIRNPLRPLISNLDVLPPFDFSNNAHYIYDKDTEGIVPLDTKFFKDVLPFLPYHDGRLKRAYRTMTDRGCPHRCAYCNVSNLKAMYKDNKTPYLRQRSVPVVIQELVDIRRRYPFIEVVQFFDDTFFARPLREIEEFAGLYRQQVGMPFYCQASPTTLTEEKLLPLIEAGLTYVEMGIQSASSRIKALYRRTESNEKVIEAAKLLHRYRSKLLPPDYHIILDNPWEEVSDTVETARLLHRLPKPYGLCISSLVFYPQTELYVKAIAEGIIKDDVTQVYRRPFYMPPKSNYQNFLIYLSTFQHFPRSIMTILLSQGTVVFFSALRLNAFYDVLYKVGELTRLVSKGLAALKNHDWRRIKLFAAKLTAKDRIVSGRKR